jgi:hypothetical protein
MPTNTILTASLPGLPEVTMTEDATPYGDEPHRFPAYRFHATLPQVCVESEEEEKALPPGYRATPYTEEEADAYVKAAAEAAAHEDEPHTRRSHR